MYEATFHLNSRPFPSAPRIDLFFPAAAIEDSLRRLSRCIERAEGPGMIVGGPGTGKSLLCEMLAKRFHERFHVVKLDSAQLCTRRALLQNILFALNLPYRGMDEGGLRLSLIDFLEPDESSRDGMLLIVDEAHTLPLRLIEETRMITNLVRDGQPRARLVLAGDLKLEEHLSNPRLESLNQRIAARCYLQPLTYDETLDYVRSQIAAVGGDPNSLLTDEALQAVYHATGGIPRLINQLSDHALVLLAARQGQRLYRSVIEEAWADLQQLPVSGPGEMQAPTADGGVVEFGALEDGFAEDGEPNDDTDVVEDIRGEDCETAAPAEPWGTVDVAEQLDAIEHQVHEIELCDAVSCDIDAVPPTEAGPGAVSSDKKDHLPDPAGGPEDDEQRGQAVACDPFCEAFAHEELVVDPYTRLELASGSSDNRQPCSQNRDFAAAVETILCGQSGSSGQADEDEAGDEDQPFPPRIASVTAERTEPELESSETVEPTHHDPCDASCPPEEAAGEATETAPDDDGAEREQAETDTREEMHSSDETDTTEVTDTGDEPDVVRARVLRSVPPDDSDLIVIVDDQLDSQELEDLPGRTHRRRYRDLFTRLRDT